MCVCVYICISYMMLMHILLQWKYSQFFFHFEIKAPLYRVYTCENWHKPKTFITSFFSPPFQFWFPCALQSAMNKRGEENDEKERDRKRNNNNLSQALNNSCDVLFSLLFGWIWSEIFGIGLCSVCVVQIRLSFQAPSQFKEEKVKNRRIRSRKSIGVHNNI